MDYTFYEKNGVGEEGASSASTEYRLRLTNPGIAETVDRATALEYAITNEPAAPSGMSLASLRVREIYTQGSPVELGEYSVQYGWDVREPQILTTQKASDPARYSARATAQSVRLKTSKEVVNTYTRTDVVAKTDHQPLVNIDENGDAEGVDVLVPKAVFSVRKVLAATSVTTSYINNALGLVGKTNASVYYSNPIGTLFCSSIGIDQDSDETFSITAEFQYEPNGTSLTIGPVSGVEKSGHDYLAAIPGPSKQIDQIEIHRFYDSANFASVLGF
jgi:hypothetical protein